MIKTSKLLVRPFKPIEEGADREPFATLTYGNVTVEIDYTIMRYLQLDIESINYAKTVGMAGRAFEEILNEMLVTMHGSIPRYHRDTEEFKQLPFTHNPLHPNNEGVS